MRRQVVTVLGKQPPEALGITDAHNHLWISPVAAGGGGSLVLDQAEGILEELKAFRKTGGGAQVDCQPGGAGRDGVRLRDLSRDSGVHVVASTGFHLRRYYPADANIWGMDVQQASELFLSEIRNGLEETRESALPVFPGLIKIAVLDTFEESPAELVEAAVMASRESGYAIQMHTEHGRGIEDIFLPLLDLGMDPKRLVVCHVDKRPDLGLHKELASAGCLLEYDTFFRAKYDPAANVWPLLFAMVEAGFAGSIGLATDMADRRMWKTMGGGPGPVGFVEVVHDRLLHEIADPSLVSALTGGNIAARLAVVTEEGLA